MFKKTSVVKEWSYKMPPTTDPDLDEVQILIDLGTAESFITFTNDTLKIADLSKEVVTEGTYRIHGSLFDGTNTTPFEITLVV